MKSILGSKITLTLFGESHGDKIGAVIDGLCAGIKVDYDFIKECLNQRNPSIEGETTRIEDDDFEIVSGVFNGYTNGNSICILMNNTHFDSKSYMKESVRPSHSDYVSYIRNHGFNDYRGGGQFSGRLTAVIVAAGAIILKALETLNIEIGYHIKQCKNVLDRNFNNVIEDIKYLNTNKVLVLDDIYEKIKAEINQAKNNNDSIGGIIQTAICNLPVGLGEPLFDSLEGKLSNALFSIGGIKGVEFGLGFDFANKNGSEVNDPFRMDGNSIITKTNNNGGINGGMSNGMPVIFNCVIKPTPSIGKTQETININSRTNTTLKIQGKHDSAIVRRVGIVIKCICALVIADLLVTRYGTDVFYKGKLD